MSHSIDPSTYNIDSLDKDIDSIIATLLDIDDKILSKKKYK